MKKYGQDHLYIFTLLYFILGIIHISTAVLALVCMAIPFASLFITNKKVWCQNYCPRASFYTRTGKTTKRFSARAPKFLVTGPVKWVMLGYFIASMLLITISTIRVSQGAMAGLDEIRLFFVIPFPKLPQLLSFEMDPWFSHMCYRFYSMMLSTTLLGLMLSLVYKPRTWCTICPIGTVSNGYVRRGK